MADRNLTLGITADNKRSQDAEKRLVAIQKSLKDLDKGFKSGRITTQQYGQEVQRLGREQLALSASLDKGGAGANKAERELLKLEAAQRKLVIAFREGKISAEQFNSSLGRIQGRAATQQRALGAPLPTEDTGRRGRGRLGEIGLAVRNAPAIPIPGTGITTEPIAKALIAVDRLGIDIASLGTAAIVAAPFVIALGIAVGELQKQIEKNIEAIQGAVDVTRRVNQAFAEGATTADIEKRIADLQRANEAEQRTAENIRKAMEGFAESGTVPAFTRLREDYKEFERQLEESQTIIAQNELEIRKYNEGLDAGLAVANDAAEAEKKLAEERSKATLAQASAAGDLVRAQKEVEELTRAEAAERVDSLKDQAAALQAELAVLKASGVTSEEVAGQIASLEGQIKSLGDQTKVFNDVASSAKPTVKELAQIEEEKARNAEKAAKSEEQSAKRVSSVRQKSVNEREKTEDKLADIDKKFQRDEAKLRQNLIDKRIDEQINLARDIEDIIIDSGRDRKRSLREGDFLGIAEINEQEAQAADDAILNNRRANQDITRNAQRQHRDLVREADLQRQDVLAVQRNMYQQSLGLTQNWANNMTSILRNFFQAATNTASARRDFYGRAPRAAG